MEQIRILHVVDSLSCSSGVLAVIMNLYENIDRDKVQFDFLVHFRKSPNYEEKILNMGGRIYNVPTPGIKTINSYYREINIFFKEHDEYKVIHGHSPSIGVFYLPFAIKSGIKHRIAHSHNSKYSDSKIKSIRNFILQMPLKRLTNNYIACSNKAGKFLFGKKNYEKGKIHILNNAVDTYEFKYDEEMRAKLRKEYGLEGRFVVGHVGRFAEQKNHKFLIEIFHEIYKKDNTAILVLVGGGELESEIKEKVSMLGIGKAVKFLGVQSNINNILQTFDVFLFPSLYEGLPVVCVEAQASGLKCFISDNITDEVDITGLVYKLSLNQSADYWAELIENEGMRYTRCDMTKTIKNKGYDIKETAKWLEQFYVEKYQNINLEIGE